MAQQLLDRAGDGRRVGQPRGLPGVAQQQEGGEPDHVGGGLVVGDQQQHSGGGDLAEAEVVAGGEPAEDVVAGAAPLLRGEAAEVVEQLGLGPAHLGLLHRGADQDAAELLEHLPVLVRDAQQQADHQGGHRQREVADQVGGATGRGHAVEGLVDDLLDLGAHRLDPLDQEVPGDHAAQPGVLGVVEAEEVGVGGEDCPCGRG